MKGVFVTVKRQAAQAFLAVAERILATPHPHAARTLGGRIAAFEQQMWEEHRADELRGYFESAVPD